MSWFPSWLPSLPSINLAVPTSIQGRFVSFVLKRSLGHLFKPGQLSSPQIDSQIGSGYVQVNDLEFDELAINAYLEGTPLTLESGSVQSVTARIPWPNPLTSTIGLSLNSLHLKFRLDKAAPRPREPRNVDLADSVLSVAESFVHEELTEKEEAGLWESIHSATGLESDDNAIPGGLDPFISNEEEMQLDPAGISLFATLIERLLARFEFDAHDIQVSVTDTDNMTLRFSFSDIRYATSTLGTTDLSGIKRTLTLQGIDVYTTNHAQSMTPASPSTVTRPLTPPRQSSSGQNSRRSSSSSMDEETEMNMSQSIAMLPPRPISPAESTSSSVYLSMIEGSHLPESAWRGPTTEGRTAPQQPLERSEEVEVHLLSLGSTPFAIHVTTPAPSTARSSNDKIKVDIELGVLAIAIQPWQIIALGLFADKLSARSNTPRPPREQTVEPNSPSSTISLDACLDLRGISVLLFSSFDQTVDVADDLTKYFARPLPPPCLRTGCTRLLIDNVTIHAAISPTSIISNAAISDISAFQFPPAPPNDQRIRESQDHIIPLLLTDPCLPKQYPQDHIHPTHDASNSSFALPKLSTLNWRDSAHAKSGTRLSQWRFRPPATQPGHSQTPSKEGEVGDHEPCLKVSFKRTAQSRHRKPTIVDQQLRIDLSPLHLFADVEMAHQDGGILAFVRDLGIEQRSYEYKFPHLATSTGSPSYSTSSLDDSDDEMAHRGHSKKPLEQQDTKLDVVLSVAMVRISVIVPPPPGRSRRSGTMVVDIHGIELSDVGRQSAPAQVRFDMGASQRLPNQSKNQLAQVQCQRIIIACASASNTSALALLSVGPLGGNDEQALLPVVRIFRRDKNRREEPEMTVGIEIPSVYLAISKDQWVSMEYWIDDLTQALEKIGSARKEISDSRTSSIIGSRYFSKSERESTFDSSKSAEVEVRVALSVSITELYARCNLPRNDPGGQEVRPFDISGSDFNAHVTMHGTGKLAAVVTFMDALVQDTDAEGKSKPFLLLTSARSLTSVPRPIIKLRFISSVVPETTAKETRLSLSLSNFTFNAYPDIQWVTDFVAFAKAPPGTFEAVVPTERTCISLKIVDGSIRAFAPKHPGALVLSIGGLHFATDIIGDSKDTSFRLDIAALAALAINDIKDAEQQRVRKGETDPGTSYWKALGYALLAEVSSAKIHFQQNEASSPEKQILVDGIKLRIHACADTFASVGAFGGDLAAHFKSESDDETRGTHDAEPAVLSPTAPSGKNLTESIDDLAFRKAPEIGPMPDMIYDDLPTNLDYLDESFGAAAGLRELTDDDLDEFDIRDIAPASLPTSSSSTGVVSSVGGETIKILATDGINIIEDYYDHIPRETVDERPTAENETLRVRLRNCDISLLLYEGYDWPTTRRTIEDEVKEMRKRLAKIRQLVASGQTQEPIPEDTSALLFNSVYIGLHEDVDATQPEALIAAIDDELRDDFDGGSQSSWQTLQHPVSPAVAPRPTATRMHGKKLTRARGPSIEFCISGANAEFNAYGGNSVVVSRTFVTVRDLEILDHIKTSTWKKFLTALRSDSKGNIRETGANMVRIELHSVRPSLGHTSEEARLRAKILPLRLYVDQDAVDFLKKFFSFKDPNTVPSEPASAPEQEAYIQMAEIFPIDLKLDYKPRRVDYRALREGKTIELMNFFHFDGAEMTLRHITLSGVTGWPKLLEMLNDLWTPDVKATQLVEVISGVAPIRSMVNVGSGVADLVLLPISQYRKDGRIVRGVQKGATAFVKSTALEAIKLGAQLATGTQVILEQVEGILGKDFDNIVTAEAMQPSAGDEFNFPEDLDDDAELISKYAQQPADIKEGVQSAYKSLHRNLSSAAQTILAVPMEVYERSGNEGPVRSVIRAVPIAVLKPMIGATEAVSKTLLGLHNTLDPEVRHENEAKYKNR